VYISTFKEGGILKNINKTITFSYDDGVTQDIRLIEILNKYNLKATFNLNSGLFGCEKTLQVAGKTVDHKRIKEVDIKSVYQGHEIAAHTLTHPLLTGLSDEEVIRQVEEDRLNLSSLCGYEVVGMAYPCGGENFDDRIVDLIKNKTGIKYARTLIEDDSFGYGENLLKLTSTCHQYKRWEKLFDIANRFFELKNDKPAVLYIWGHSYEFDAFPNRWEEFEEFCKFISGRKDIIYGTNKEILLNNI